MYNRNWVSKHHLSGLTVKLNMVLSPEEMEQYICASHIKVTVKKFGTMLLDTVLLQVQFRICYLFYLYI